MTDAAPRVADPSPLGRALALRATAESRVCPAGVVTHAELHSPRCSPDDMPSRPEVSPTVGRAQTVHPSRAATISPPPLVLDDEERQRCASRSIGGDNGTCEHDRQLPLHV